MTIIEQLEAAQAEVTSIKANLEAAQTAVSAKDTEINALKSQLSDLQAAKDGIEAKHSESITELQGKLAAEIKARAEVEAKVSDLAKKLSDPAFKVAGIEGDKTAVPEGGVVSGGVEAKTLSEQMKDIKDPKARRAFYLANEKEIKAGN